MRARSRPALRHVLALLAGLAVCTFVFFYTGDSDLFAVIGSGLGAFCFVHLGALVTAQREERIQHRKTRAF